MIQEPLNIQRLLINNRLLSKFHKIFWFFFQYLVCFFTGISKKGPPSRHLLPLVAFSRPPVPPRIKSSRTLWLCFSSAQRRSLCQSLSLHKNRSANSATSSRTYKYKKQQRSKYQLVEVFFRYNLQ